MELRASYTLFAEGCRGSLTKKLVERYGLREGVAPQTYALGVKELWEIPRRTTSPAWCGTPSAGRCPADTTYGGSWLYMLGENLVSIGFVVGLDYPNPWLSPFDEFQRFKTHPAVRPMLEGGKRIAYGRAGAERGRASRPSRSSVFPGGALIGDCAGFLNVPKIKGTHTSMKSGMVAAEAAAEVLGAGEARPALLSGYPRSSEASWVWEELRNTRNIRPAFAKLGFWGGLAYSALDAYVLRGKAPWTMGHHQDHETLRPASQSKRIEYPRPTASSPSTACPPCSWRTPTTRRTSRSTSSCATRRAGRR
jgi:electron-transferring-flavoprotein dehydrogenase